MPRLSLETNLPASKIPENFAALCIDLTAKLTGKKETFCITYISTGMEMYFGGSDEPCGYANVSSVLGFNVEENKIYFQAVSNLIEQYVGIPKERLYMICTDNVPELVAFKGQSFYQLLMCRPEGAPATMAHPD